jgi:hypothetical protein
MIPRYPNSVSNKLSFFPDSSAVIPGAPRHLTGVIRSDVSAAWLVFGTLTLFQSSDNHSHHTFIPVIKDPSYSHISQRRSQLLKRPVGMHL